MTADGFLFDLNRCTGCGACVLACIVENGQDEAVGWRRVYTFNEVHHPGVASFHLSLACNHCLNPPCAAGCPALAYERDTRKGPLLLRQERCIGCRYCSWACPFDAPRLRTLSGVMSKCTWCNHRLLDGLKPACVTSCPTGALGFGDLASMPSRGATGFPDAACRPSMAFRPLRDGAAGPECAAEGETLLLPPAPAATGGRISLRSEWPLLVFTLAAALLVALSTAWLPGNGGAARSLLVACAGATVALSLLHLGRKGRAWRAFLNIRRSWLSREVAAFALFSVGLAAPLVPRLTHPFWDWVALVSSLFLLWAIDRVYDVLRPKVPAMFHSAGVLLTGVFLTGCVAGLPLVAGAAGALKLGLYLGRFLLNRPVTARKRSALQAAVRLGLPLIAGALYVGGIAPSWLALFLVVAGEAVDRLEFYMEIELQSPAREMERELQRAIGQSAGGPAEGVR